VKTYRIVWRSRAEAQLLALYDWIADQADPQTAFAYTSAIEAHTAKLTTFPERGTPRDDIASGVRTVPYRRRTIIAYRVLESEVEVLSLVHGGQTFASMFDD
jgi:toxin ParE1/3/4